MSPADRASGRVLVLVGIVVLAVNLRPAAVSVGPVLDDVRAGLDMSGTEAGILTALPVVAFAVFGSLASRLAGIVGPHRITALSLAGVTVGLFARSRVDGVVPFLLLSLVALGGMATANVVLPSLVKLHFPERVGTLTAVYSTALAVGITGSSVLTVPISEASGSADGWRSGLAAWSLLAALALVPWLALVGRDRDRVRPVAADRIPLSAIARTRTGRFMAAFFALQSLQAYAVFGWFAAIYRDAGYSASTAGLLLGVITGTSIPLSFLVPSLAGRMTNLTPLVLALAACYPVGYVGLALAPHDLAVLWALLVGAGTCTFPLVLVLIGLRSRTPEGTASLSAFTQSVGYLFSAVGPFGFGVLHDLTDGWTVPLLALTALIVPLAVCGLALARPSYVEDELALTPPAS
ncbi:MFS transporter [Nocardioides sp.]|uniref:MFS transporter n=1 Tax=Nocardioides sp. TaxID=35761 RepID=UPI002728D9E7|nr:MFS transporter [Nocardioides sp.]MDO9458436.1 MFS transporter [Nocardioides sp.]